ncbi:MAG: hypothetical protein K2W96_20025 [Gemmataceae bacterium]|nr:hypothetical protein [Gemmataceae bacterium]
MTETLKPLAELMPFGLADGTKVRAALEAVAKDHPEGLVTMLRGHWLAQEGELAEGIAVLERAVDAPAVVPVRRACLILLAEARKREADGGRAKRGRGYWRSCGWCCGGWPRSRATWRRRGRSGWRSWRRKRATRGWRPCSGNERCITSAHSQDADPPRRGGEVAR